MRSCFLLLTVFFASSWSLVAQVRFRLPLSSDTSVHYYYDHDDTAGVQDWDCGSESYNGHHGTDFSGGPRGRAIFAAAVGTLDNKIDGFGDGYFGSPDGGGGGNQVRLAHASGFKTYYFHMNNGSVTTKSIGSDIACGEQIGGVGTSGNSTGFHLHFEPRLNGAVDDPYAGTCGGPTSYWIDQGTGSPTTNCTTASPSNLSVTSISTNQIRLSWIDRASNESGFRVERASILGGPWTQVASLGANITNYTNGNLVPSTTWFFRVCAYNAAGNSEYSNRAQATTQNSAPNLPVISNRVVSSGAAVAFTVSATDAGNGIATVLTDFESSFNGAGSVLFRPPGFANTSSFLDASPNVCVVTNVFPAFPTTTEGGVHTLLANWSFKTGTTDPWLRLTTLSAGVLPNPTVGFQQKLHFSLRTDRSLRVGIGLRETGTSASIGADGGSTGTIEFLGVPNATGSTPNPSRVVPANVWSNLVFDFPSEAVFPFTGDGVLTSPTGKGVFEQLTFVPNAGTGAYKVHLDNFMVLQPNFFTYALDPGAPAGASINPTNGVFTWSAPSVSSRVTNSVTVRVTDNGSPPLNSARLFQLITIPLPRITSGIVTNGQFQLSWGSYPGKSYRVQFKNDLDDETWTNLGDILVADGDSASFVDAVDTQRFYRIVQID